jgi:protein SCO1/2
MAARGSVIALALLGVLGAAGQPLAQRSDRSAAELMDAVMWNREPIGGPFALIDQDGKRRTDADFRGKVLLVYFGFTYCPDVCPTDLQEMTGSGSAGTGRRCRAAHLHHGSIPARYA